MNTYEILTNDGYRTIKADWFEAIGPCISFCTTDIDGVPYLKQVTHYYSSHYIKMIRIEKDGKQQD